MIYRSNLIAPDLTLQFRHLHVRPIPGYSFGHDLLSDWADKPEGDPVFGLYKKCGFWSHDEAAILYHIALDKKGRWLDIGAHTGWTAAHIAKAGGRVTLVEPMWSLAEWQQRGELNLEPVWEQIDEIVKDLALVYFRECGRARFTGVVIDGDHMSPHPKNDALNADAHLHGNGVILFHDGTGGPVWDGVTALLDRGYKAHVYLTGNVVIACWPDNWKPPIHVPDPAIDWREIQSNHMKGFPWKRVTHDVY